jgi:hypothetical protein
MKDCTELTKGEVIAIDGKTVRGSYDDSRGLGAIHMVNQGSRMLFSQCLSSFRGEILKMG